MPKVVSNSSTLIHLAQLGRLDLLREFCKEILIPPAVWREVVEEGRGRPGAYEVEKAIQEKWIKVKRPADQRLLRLLKRDLDEGEAETIVLALEQKAELILLDQSEAREVAELYGLSKTGIIGILMRAKERGRITSLRQELDRLREETGFWIDEALYRKALKAVGEE